MVRGVRRRWRDQVPASIVGLCGSILLAAGAAYAHEEFLPPMPPPPRPPGPTLATVNGAPVTFRDYEDAEKSLPPDLRTPKQILRQAIHYELLRQEGVRLGFDKDPGLTALLERLRSEYAKYQLVQREMDRLGSIPGAELRQYYAAHQEEFGTPEQMTASHILLKSRQAAETVLRELKAGAVFAALAGERSEDAATKELEGQLPPFSRGQMSAEFERAAFALKPGEFSGVVEDAEGFHLIRARARIPATLPPFEEVKARIQEQMTEERLKNRFEALYAEAEGKGIIQYKEEAIAKLMAPAPENPKPDVVLATVNRTAITVHDFGHAFFSLDRPGREAARKDPKPVMRAIIHEELRRQEGLRLGLDRDLAFVQFLEAYTRGYLIRKVMGPVMAKAPKVSEEAMRQYYEAHKDEFTDPEMVAVSHILLKSREAAETVLAELKAGAEFAALARERSEDPATKADGGRLSPIRRQQRTPEFEQAAFALKPGELSGVVEDAAGFHIIKVHRYYPARLKSFEAVKGWLQHPLTEQARQIALEKDLADLEKQATIEIDQEALAKLQ